MNEVNKINIGYGSVEFLSDKGYNINTKPSPLKSNDGVQIEPITCEVKQMNNLQHVYGFLDEVLFEPLYVAPVDILSSEEGVYTALFSVNHKFFLHVVVAEGEIFTSLLIYTGEEQTPIKFEFEGVTLERFFDEVKKDITNLIDKCES